MNLYTRNKNIISHSIDFANSNLPFRFSQTNVLTHRYMFPYTNWFQGKYISDVPIIADREAGFYPINTNTSQNTQYNKDDEEYPDHCFRGAIQQTKPCVPYYNDGIVDVKEFDPTLMVNRKLVLYR